MTTHDPQAVLSFWFGEPAADAAALRRKVERWYGGGAALDREIADEFGATLDAALAGELDGWARDIDTRLALVIVLDQFPRSIHRDDPRAYAGDAAAQRLAVGALDRGMDRVLPLEKRLFLLMPLLHAEDAALQERGVRETERLRDDAPPELQPIYGMSAEQANKYRQIVGRFGRFPHRNAILGRTSTAEELEFLKDWSAKAPPKGMRR